MTAVILTSNHTQAKHDFAQHGLPSRKFESWKHTPIGLFQTSGPFTPASTASQSAFLTGAAQLYFSPYLQLEHSQFNPEHIQCRQQAVHSLQKDLENYPITYAKHPLACQVITHEDQVQVIDILGSPKMPVYLVHRLTPHAESDFTTALKLIRIKAGSTVTLLEEVQSDCSQTFNHLSLIHLEPGAHLTYLSLGQASLKSPVIHGIHCLQEANSETQITALHLNHRALRQDITVYLRGEQASTHNTHTLFAQNQAHLDQHVCIHHLSPHTQSKVDIRAVSADQSCTVSHANVCIPKGADHTDASQNLHHLLLSPKARAATEPELEVNTDQVKCAHGATVGQLDTEALHYCLSRGISKEAAYQMLTQAFLADRFSSLPDQLKDSLQHCLDQTLEQYFGKK